MKTIKSQNAAFYASFAYMMVIDMSFLPLFETPCLFLFGGLMVGWSVTVDIGEHSICCNTAGSLLF